MGRGGAVDPDPHRRAETYGAASGGFDRRGECIDIEQREVRRASPEQPLPSPGDAGRRSIALVAALDRLGRGPAGQATRSSPTTSSATPSRAPTSPRGAVKPADLDLDQGRRRAVGPLPTASTPRDRPRRPVGDGQRARDRAGRDLRARRPARSTAAAAMRRPRCTCSSPRCSPSAPQDPRVRLGRLGSSRITDARAPATVDGTASLTRRRLDRVPAPNQGKYTFSLRYSRAGRRHRRRSPTPACGRGCSARQRGRRRGGELRSRAGSAPSASASARPAPRARPRSRPRARSRSPAAISRMSSSTRPRVVSAGVPIRRPEGFIGGRSSNGIALRLTVIPTSSRRSSAVLPSSPVGVRSTSTRWTSVPPVSTVDPAGDQLLGERLRVGDRLPLARAEGLGLRRSPAPPPWRR